MLKPVMGGRGHDLIDPGSNEPVAIGQAGKNSDSAEAASRRNLAVLDAEVAWKCEGLVRHEIGAWKDRCRKMREPFAPGLPEFSARS
jgi:hypothetical protein